MIKKLFTLYFLLLPFTFASAATSRTGAMVARMPSMPIIPINSIGNNATDITVPADNNNGGTITPTDPTGPTTPDKPDRPDKPNKPGDGPDKPNNRECPDGGVKNSEYGVDQCMNEILACVNNGALPGGLNDLFNADLRNSIFNGMNLCATVVDKCISTVRVDCENIYDSSADVWWDFNSRKVQPAYYEFILRKTGLTPNQAENTCYLLDVNTYGPSFAAVANSDATTSEYAKRVGAYNSQNGGILVKNNPMGATPNYGNPGVDGARGHYARWDATTGTCLIRVGAYNKDTQITNSWLFGAAGDDRIAEAWVPAGDAFTCNKDMFGFSLMPKANTALVAGLGGGTVLGAGIGALAGHGARDLDCGNKQMLRQLTSELRGSGQIGTLNEYLDSKIPTNVDMLTEMQCTDLANLYALYNQAKTARCDGVIENEYYERTEISADYIIAADFNDANGVRQNSIQTSDGKTITWTEFQSKNDDGRLYLNTMVEDTEQSNTSNTSDKCFKNINIARRDGTDIYCHNGGNCINRAELNTELNRLGDVFTALETIKGQDSSILNSTLTGAGIGAGAGGLATAITAFVERNNVNCRVGDGLDRVAFGKSYSVDTLKDFYVKWKLQLPDSIMPTAMVTDCNSWKYACGSLIDMSDCDNAQINYRPTGRSATTLISSACIPSGTTCIENEAVAKSYGACRYKK